MILCINYKASNKLKAPRNVDRDKQNVTKSVP